MRKMYYLQMQYKAYNSNLILTLQKLKRFFQKVVVYH